MKLVLIFWIPGTAAAICTICIFRARRARVFRLGGWKILMLPSARGNKCKSQSWMQIQFTRQKVFKMHIWECGAWPRPRLGVLWSVSPRDTSPQSTGEPAAAAGAHWENPWPRTRLPGHTTGAWHGSPRSCQRFSFPVSTHFPSTSNYLSLCRWIMAACGPIKPVTWLAQEGIKRTKNQGQKKKKADWSYNTESG